MKEKIQKEVINKYDLEMILISALRYALDRRSYIMSWTEEVITKYHNEHTLSNNTIGVMIRDIHESLEYRKKGYNNGQHDWTNLLILLEGAYQEKYLTNAS